MNDKIPVEDYPKYMNKVIEMIATDIAKLGKRKGLDISKYTGIDKRKTLRNCVEPETAQHILNCAINPIKLQKELAL